MASVAGEGEAVDFGYLEGFCANDQAVVVDILVIFREQAQTWAETLREPPGAWRELMHNIKGSARGIGARRLGDTADRAEASTDPASLTAVQAELAEAVAEIEGYLTRVGGG